MSSEQSDSGEVDLEAAHEAAVSLRDAWQVIDPGLAYQERTPAIVRELRAGAFAVIGKPYPPRLGDKPVLLTVELLRRALAHPTVELAIVSSEISTGNPRQGGLEFYDCRIIGTEQLAAYEETAAGTGAASEQVEGATLIGFFKLLRSVSQALEDLCAASMPPPPSAKIERLVQVLARLFFEDERWETADDDRLAEIVAERDRSFRPHSGPPKHGRWSKGTLLNRIAANKSEARELAAELREERQSGG
jgi:hypothetical protein